MGKSEDSALWSEIGRYAAVFSAAIALNTVGVALASLEQLLAWFDTLFSTMLSVFAALVIDLALFLPPLPLSPRDLMPSAFTLKDPI